MSENLPVLFLPWDTEFFGRRIARVTTHTLDSSIAEEIIAWSQREAIDCMYLLAASDHPDTLRLAAEIGFRFVDARVTYTLPLGQRFPIDTTGVSYRLSQPSDLEPMRLIAQNTFTDSRFYADGNFSHEHCDKMYDIWLEKAFKRGDDIHIAVIDGEPVGFMTTTFHDQTGKLDLMGLDTRFRGRGIGNGLVSSALNGFIERGLTTSEVVTQGRNLIAQRLYQKLGMRISQLQLWYHWWRHEQYPQHKSNQVVNPSAL